MKIYTTLQFENLKEKESFKTLGVDGKVGLILK
jgi:hypothetical protein